MQTTDAQTDLSGVSNKRICVSNYNSLSFMCMIFISRQPIASLSSLDRIRCYCCRFRSILFIHLCFNTNSCNRYCIGTLYRHICVLYMYVYVYACVCKCMCVCFCTILSIQHVVIVSKQPVYLQPWTSEGVPKSTEQKINIYKIELIKFNNKKIQTIFGDSENFDWKNKLNCFSDLLSATN